MSLNVLRLCRTFPRKEFPGIGLQPYYFSQYSKFNSIIFTKKIQSPLRFKNSHQVYEVSYRENQFNENGVQLFPFITKVYGELKMLYSVLKNLNWRNFPEVIHCHSVHYILTSVVLKILFGSPVVLSLGGTDLKRLSHFKRFGFVLNHIDAVVYVAESMSKEINAVFKKTKNIHISNGVDHTIFFHQNKDRKPYFLAVGNFRWQKGYKHLLKAFEKLINVHSDYELYIVGDFFDVKLEKEILNWDKIKDRVSFLGIKTQEEINLLLNKCYCYVISSVSEGLPKSLIEAITTGTPIITTNVGDCENIAINKGIIVPPKNEEKLFDAMKFMIENPSSWSNFHNESLKDSKKYSWSNMSEIMDELYLNLYKYK